MMTSLEEVELGLEKVACLLGSLCSGMYILKLRPDVRKCWSLQYCFSWSYEKELEGEREEKVMVRSYDE